MQVDKTGLHRLFGLRHALTHHRDHRGQLGLVDCPGPATREHTDFHATATRPQSPRVVVNVEVITPIIQWGQVASSGVGGSRVVVNVQTIIEIQWGQCARIRSAGVGASCAPVGVEAVKEPVQLGHPEVRRRGHSRRGHSRGVDTAIARPARVG